MNDDELDRIIDLKKGLKPNPYLFTRISGKIERRENEGRLPIYFIKKALYPAISVAAIVLGIYTGSEILNTNTENTNTRNIAYFNDMELENLENILATP